MCWCGVCECARDAAYFRLSFSVVRSSTDYVISVEYCQGQRTLLFKYSDATETSKISKSTSQNDSLASLFLRNMSL